MMWKVTRQSGIVSGGEVEGWRRIREKIRMRLRNLEDTQRHISQMRWWRDPYEEVAQQGQTHPLSPAYVPDPMEFDEHVLVYVLEPEHPEYHAPSDDDIQVEDQPYADDASPTAESPGYIADLDSMEEDTDEDSIDYPDEPDDGEEDDDEDPEEDPEEDPSEEHEPEDDDDDDDTDDEDEEPTEDEDEEEHIAPVDSSAIPIVDLVPSAGDTKAFETDESAPTPGSPQTRVPFS
ncbi:hypothetical protein Tco_1347211 [Tanacetum coccineum]